MNFGPGDGAGGGGAPDWVVIGGAIATMLTVVGGIVAGMQGRLKGQADDRDVRRVARDTAATANATLTLDSVFRLVNELQEEAGRKSTEITRIERMCLETKDALLVRIGELEVEVRGLRKTQSNLEDRIRGLREQLRVQDEPRSSLS